MNILVIGRPANIVNLNVDNLQNEAVNIITASSKDEITDIIQANEINAIVIGAGLDASDRIEIVKELITKAYDIEIHLNAKNTGPEGLKLFVSQLIKE